MFAPSGIPTKVAAASSFQFTSSQKEGVLAVVNQSSTNGFAALTNASGSLKKNYVPVLANGVQYLAFSNPYNTVDVLSTELMVLPGYEEKKRIPAISMVDVLRLIPRIFLLPFPEYLRQDQAGTIPVKNSNDDVGIIKDLSGNVSNFIAIEGNVAALIKPKYIYDGVTRSIRSKGDNSPSMLTYDFPGQAMQVPITRVSAWYFNYPSAVPVNDKFNGALSNDGGFRQAFQANLGGTPYMTDGANLALPAPISQYLNRKIVMTEVYNSVDSLFMADKTVSVSGDSGTSEITAGATIAIRYIFGERQDQAGEKISGDYFGGVEFARALPLNEIYTCIDYFDQVMNRGII